MAGYFYHPVGDYAQHYIDGDIDLDQYPRSYDTPNPHGWGKIDWALPGGTPIYSMTNGYVSTIKDVGYDKSGGEGYAVIILTDKQDSKGAGFYINYIEMGGLADPFATALGVEAGPDTWSGTEKAVSASKEEENANYYQNWLPVKMGDLIGYANSMRDYSNVHIDFTY